MTRLEKIQLAIDKGVTCNPDTGQVFGVRGKEYKTKYKNDYIRFSIQEKCTKYSIKAHQFIWYWVNKEIVECIDHINNDKLDNRICNLRSVNQQKNCFNRANVKGYTKHGNKFRAKIHLDDKDIHIGLYNTEDEAREAYLKAKQIYHEI